MICAIGFDEDRECSAGFSPLRNLWKAAARHCPFSSNQRILLTALARRVRGLLQGVNSYTSRSFQTGAIDA